MDTQNIQALLDTFTSLGFSPAVENQLLYHACLRQKVFSITEQKVFGTDTVTYSISLRMKELESKLVCSFYDASLRKEIKADLTSVKGVESDKLEERMRSLDWKQLSAADSIAKVRLNDKKTLEEPMLVESIISDLEKLAATGEGRRVADILRYKYWADLPLERFIPNLLLLKSRLELSQRFYVLDGEGITTEEAYRFLNNRWIQRQLQLKNRNSSGNALAEVIAPTSRSGGKKGSDRKTNRTTK